MEGVGRGGGERRELGAAAVTCKGGGGSPAAARAVAEDGAGGTGGGEGATRGSPSLLLPSCPPPHPAEPLAPWSPVQPAGGETKAAGEGGREPAGQAGGRRRWSGRRRQREEGGGGGGRAAAAAAARGGGGGGDSTWESDIGYKFNSSPVKARRWRAGGRGAVLPGGGAEAPGRACRAGGPRTAASPGLASRTRQPPPRPLLPPSGGRRRSSWLPPPQQQPRGLLLTLRKTPDVRGWLAATGGSGFPAPRPRLRLAASAPRPRQALVPRLPCPAPLRPAATRAPSASSRENTFPGSPRRGARVPAGKFWASPSRGGPRRRRRGTRGRARLTHPPTHRTGTPRGCGPRARKLACTRT